MASEKVSNLDCADQKSLETFREKCKMTRTGVHFKLSLTKTFDPYGVIPHYYYDPLYQYPTPNGVQFTRKIPIGM
jgi:hypothetical protein